MNEARVHALAKDRQIEFTKKMLKRILRQQIDLNDLLLMLSKAEIKNENVLSYPDFNYQMSVTGKGQDHDVIITQTADGRAIRIVGFVNRKNNLSTTKRAKE